MSRAKLLSEFIGNTARRLRSFLFFKQRVRVDLNNPVGALRVAEVFTDNAGIFSVAFDLRYEPSIEADRKKWKKAKVMLKGTYRAQARIVAADEVASAESAMVFIQR